MGRKTRTEYIREGHSKFESLGEPDIDAVVGSGQSADELVEELASQIPE